MSEENTLPQTPDYGTDMTTGHIGRELWKFALPMLMGSTLQTAYGIVNAIWVGNGLGKNAIAALAITFPVIFFLMAIAMGMTMASNILVSQAYGAKEYSRVKLIVNNSLILTAVVSSLCLAAGYFSAEPLIRIMGTPPEVFPLAVKYMKIFIWTIPFTFALFLTASVLRGVGDSITPLYYQGGSVLLAAILDPLMMFGWLGFPRLGLNGTAYVTIICQALGVLALHLHIHHKSHIISPDFKAFKFDPTISYLTIKIGIPTMIQQLLVSTGMVVLVGMINQYGSNGTAVFGIAIRVDQLAFLPAMTIGMAVSTLAGQNIGAQRYDRVKQVFNWGILLSGGITLTIAVLANLFPRLLLRLFVQDQTVINMGVPYLRIMSVGYLFISVFFVSNGIINGSGYTYVTTLISIFGLWIVRIPLASYFSHSMHRLDGIWYAIMISMGISMILSTAYYLSGYWKKPLGIIDPVDSIQEII